MKAKKLWDFISEDTVVIFTVQDEVHGSMWRRDTDQPELLERDVVTIKPLENRVLMLQVAGGEK